MQEDKYLTIDDLAERTQLPKSWWYSQSRQRKINGLKVIVCGKYLRFLWPDVEEFLCKLNDAN